MACSKEDLPIMASVNKDFAKLHKMMADKGLCPPIEEYIKCLFSNERKARQAISSTNMTDTAISMMERYRKRREKNRNLIRFITRRRQRMSPGDEQKNDCQPSLSA